MLRNRTLLAVSLTVCAAYVGVGMVGPVRVLYAQSRGASLVIIGAMASSYLISNFVFQYPVGATLCCLTFRRGYGSSHHPTFCSRPHRGYNTR